MSRIYVGLKLDGTCTREVFRAVAVPTDTTHGAQYGAVIGPFRTVRGAKFMRDYGRGNPHCYTVADAEQLSKRASKPKAREFDIWECQPGLFNHWTGEPEQGGYTFAGKRDDGTYEFVTREGKRERWARRLGGVCGYHLKRGRSVYEFCGSVQDYQPKTGAKCGCKRGQERDNCSQCEGTGMVIDFRAIRARRVQVPEIYESQDVPGNWGFVGCDSDCYPTKVKAERAAIRARRS